MKKIKNNIDLGLYLIIIAILTFLMFWAIKQKEGFHEDEIFSYGASNSLLGGVFVSNGRVDDIDTLLKGDNTIDTIKNTIHYFFNFNEAVKEKEIIRKR